MALLDAKEFNFGRQNIWATTVGAADLPTTNANGLIQLGDQVRNLSGTAGTPAYWVCTNSGTTPVWSAVGSLGLQVSTPAGAAYTISPQDRFVIMGAGSVTVPAATALTTGYPVTVNASASSVTITPASGSISGAAAITLTSGQDATIVSNGTSLYRVQ